MRSKTHGKSPWARWPKTFTRTRRRAGHAWAIAEALESRLLLTGDTILASFSGGSTPGYMVMDSNGDLFGVTENGGAYNDGTIFEIPKGSSTINTLASFNGTDGRNPLNSLTLDAAGNLWGTAEYGGANSYGAVFELPAGSNTITSISFNGTSAANPTGGVIFDGSGNLYGTTSVTTTGNDFGTIYEIAKGTTTINVLAKFNGNNGNGPWGTIAMDSSGDIFGASPYGGANGFGTLFELIKGSSTITLLASFTGAAGAHPGEIPVAGVTMSAGNLYGTTELGGPSDDGTVFEWALPSNVFTPIADFAGSNGKIPEASFSLNSSGNLYGTTFSSNIGQSVVFMISDSGGGMSTEADVPATDGGVVVDANGDIFGTTVSGGTFSQGSVFEVPFDTFTVNTLASFQYIPGVSPSAAPVMDSSGNLYGTTFSGGASDDGTVFEVPSGGTLETLDQFDGANGNQPLTLALEGGNLYGITESGGAYDKGSIFEIPLASGSTAITTLASFNGTDGSAPTGNIVFDQNGNLYGTTVLAGAHSAGTVFELPNGSSTIMTVASFNKTNGYNPEGGVTIDSSGDLFGTTRFGGADSEGTVFEIVAGSGQITVLASFTLSDGAYPQGGVILDNSGDLYGMTATGGTDDLGTIFEITPQDMQNNTVTTLVSFNGADGENPVANLVSDSNGNLYGTTEFGGADGDGGVFVLPQGQTQTVPIYNFTGPPDGQYPQATLLLVGNQLYSTTTAGGAAGNGALFEMSIPNVIVNAADSLGAVNTQMLGVNLATWDGNLTDTSTNPTTQQLVQAAGLDAFRLPGGSTSDVFHWDSATGGPQSYGSSIVTMANFVAALGATGSSIVTINYGTGSPGEAAAELAYLNAPINDPAIDNVVIGQGETWSPTSNSWVAGGVTQSGQSGPSWQTVGYWADLRAGITTSTYAPDGYPSSLSFLDIGRAAPFGFQYWEVGNEVYGSWETDEHGQAGDDLPMPGGVTTGQMPHDPTTYISFASQFAALAKQIDPGISIGIGTQSSSTLYFNDWLSDILSQSVAQGFTPGFLSDHIYAQYGGQESDSGLLASDVTPLSGTLGTNGTSDINSYDITQRAQIYRNLLNYYFGAAAQNIQLLGTEFNSVSSSPGTQTTNLVNSLYVADVAGQMLDSGTTGYKGLWIWALHNGNGGGDDLSTLYGWRTFGDYGILADSNDGVPTNEPLPDYFAEQLLSEIVQPGGTVVQVTGDSANDLDAFGVLEPDGDLDLLVVNKNMTGLNLNATGTPALLSEMFDVGGFVPSGQAEIWQYGSAQDNVEQTSDTTALANFTTALTINGSSFTYSFPSYSMTVMQLAPVNATVKNSYVFYYHSSFDNGDTSPSSYDYNAIAESANGTDKTALAPGHTGTFANVSSYADGINGILIDFGNEAAGVTFTAGDFAFAVGNNNTPSTWGAAPTPTAIATWIGPNNDTFADITWANNAIQEEWLQVTVVADANTHLASNDVFYFGSLIGATGTDTADSGTILQVTAGDLVQTQNNASLLSNVPISNLYDYNRDGYVTAADLVLCQNNATLLGGLEFITPGSSAPAVAPPAKSVGTATTVKGAAKTATVSFAAASGSTTALGQASMQLLSDEPILTSLTQNPLLAGT